MQNIVYGLMQTEYSCPKQWKNQHRKTTWFYIPRMESVMVNI